MDVRDVTRHRGEFFRVLQQTDRSQTAVMTIPPGEDARRRCAWTARSAAWAPARW
jgi:hypothetical protein